MTERTGPMTEERLSLHKADCRAAGGSLSIPCEEGLLVIAGPSDGWTFTLDGEEVAEDRVLGLTQSDHSY